MRLVWCYVDVKGYQDLVAWSFWPLDVCIVLPRLEQVIRSLTRNSVAEILVPEINISEQFGGDAHIPCPLTILSQTMLEDR